MSFNEIDDTLVSYFKQMLGVVESEDAEQTLALNENDKSNRDLPVSDAKESESEQAHAHNEDNIDYASEDYQPSIHHGVDSLTTDQSLDPKLQTQLQDETQEAATLPYAEHKSLESLLESVNTKTHVATEIKVATETKVEEKVETKTEIVEKTQNAVEVKDTTADDMVVQKEAIDETENPSPYEWSNIEMPSEFQALFFLCKGIRFAVPLVNLGGIFQCDKITHLFGKPDWFQGIADIRGRKMNVVDTLKWVKNDAPLSDKYEYMIALDKTLWSIGCDELEGNRILSRESVNWRQTAGNRPWLAGIVKKEMCALLHVEALVKMFENGVNLKDLDLQMSA